MRELNNNSSSYFSACKHVIILSVHGARYIHTLKATSSINFYLVPGDEAAVVVAAVVLDGDHVLERQEGVAPRPEPPAAPLQARALAGRVLLEAVQVLLLIIKIIIIYMEPFWIFQ